MNHSSPFTQHDTLLLAPLSGPVIPVSQVPDPVFSERMLGDGIAIDPTDSILLAPLDAEIAQLHAAHHALTLRTDSGVEILIHIGLDTAALHGEGFSPRVSEGDRVKAGQTLLEFDADYLACHARSLITIIVQTGPESLPISYRASGYVKAGDDPLLAFKASSSTSAPDAPIQTRGDPDAEACVRIANPAGLHARPSAVLAQLCRQNNVTVKLTCHNAEARGDSVTELMKLNTRSGDDVTIKVWGNNAQGAINSIVTAIESGLGEEVTPVSSRTSAVEKTETPLLACKQNDARTLSGVRAAPGISTGQLVHIRRQHPKLQERTSDTATEQHQLQDAIAATHDALQQLITRLETAGEQEQSMIFSAHTQLLEDPALIETANQLITQGYTAAWAWNDTVSQQVHALQSLDNPLLAGRAADIYDVGQRVLAALTGISSGTGNWPDHAIPVYQNITPSDLFNLDRNHVAGICSLEGGASSHAAIIARSMGIPYLAGVDSRIDEQPDGTTVIMNANAGHLLLSPTDDEISRCQRQKDEAERTFQAALQTATRPAVTRDGMRIEVAANVGGLEGAQKAVKLGAEGIGLLRTEFLYLYRTTEPDEDEQTQIYSSIISTMGTERPVIIRTLDVGGDKPLPYLSLPEEENPFLGERGIRVGINRPSMLRRQIRALLRSAKVGNLRILLPMIASLEEFRAVRKLVEEECQSLDSTVELGIMVEVPSAALMARELAREADFFSIGTNDLTQYTLAMDRGHPKLASRIDSLHPAVLRLIAMTVEGARAENRRTAICGGIASDITAIPLLLGLGVNELSVSVPSLPLVKARIRELNLADCHTLAQQALTMEDAAPVRALLAQWKTGE